MLIGVAALALAGCAKGPSAPAPLSEAELAALPGVYAGTFPCSNCAGILTRVWLRADGRFFLAETYEDSRADAGAATGRAVDAYDLGRWSQRPATRIVDLRGAGPTRSFEVVNDRRLRMITSSTLDYTLAREAAGRAFDYRVRLQGLLAEKGRRATFTECLTGLGAPLGTGGDYRRLMRQYRSLGARSVPLFVELEGRFDWSRDGRLEGVTVDRLITLKPQDAC